MKALNIIVAADIFGKSVEFEKLCQQIELSIAEPTTVKFHVDWPLSATTRKFFTSEKQCLSIFYRACWRLEAYSEIITVNNRS